MGRLRCHYYDQWLQRDGLRRRAASGNGQRSLLRWPCQSTKFGRNTRYHHRSDPRAIQLTVARHRCVEPRWGDTQEIALLVPANCRSTRTSIPSGFIRMGFPFPLKQFFASRPLRVRTVPNLEPRCYASTETAESAGRAKRGGVPSLR